jgi:hypothetical protein
VPAIYTSKLHKIKLKIKSNNFKNNIKKTILISIILVSFIIIGCVAINLMELNIGLLEMFNIKNFENFYAPIILSSSIIFNCILTKILIK